VPDPVQGQWGTSRWKGGCDSRRLQEKTTCLLKNKYSVQSTYSQIHGCVQHTDKLTYTCWPLSRHLQLQTEACF